LNNELYVGWLVWNHCAYVKVPCTGRRLARPNPPERWVRVEVPDLRIVEDALWERVKARQRSLALAMARDAAGNALNRAHRRKYLLSRLLVCGVCGGVYTIMAKDRYGCAAHRYRGTCGSDRTVSRPEIEAGSWTGSSTGCWRLRCSRRLPAPTSRNGTSSRARRPPRR
jgi:hypothetical protein